MDKFDLKIWTKLSKQEIFQYRNENSKENRSILKAVDWEKNINFTTRFNVTPQRLNCHIRRDNLSAF